MLVLRDVRSLHVHERRIRLNDAVIAQILQGHQIFGLTDAIEKSSAKSKRAKIAVDGAEKLLRTRQTQGHVADVVVLHVVAALQVLAHVPTRSSSRDIIYSERERVGRGWGKRVKRERERERERDEEEGYK